MKRIFRLDFFFFLVSISFILVYACRNRLQEGINKRLEANVLFSNVPLVDPGNMEIVDSLLIFVENNGDHLLTIFNKNNKTITRRCRKGNGPNEFLSIWNLEYDPSSNTFSVYDLIKNQLAIFDFDSLMHSSNYQPSIYKINSKMGRPTFLRRFDSSNIVFTGNLSDGVIVKHNTLDNSSATYGYHTKDVKNFSSKLANQAYSYIFTHNTTSHKTLMLSQTSDRLLLFDSSFNVIVDKRLEDGINPIFEVKSRGGFENVAYSDLSINYYNTLYSTNNHIYALFVGTSSQEKPDGYLVDEIHVYNWDGDIVRKLHLNERIVYCVVDKEENYIISWIIDDEGKVNIIKFKID